MADSTTYAPLTIDIPFKPGEGDSSLAPKGYDPSQFRAVGDNEPAADDSKYDPSQFRPVGEGDTPSAPTRYDPSQFRAVGESEAEPEQSRWSSSGNSIAKAFLKVGSDTLKGMGILGTGFNRVIQKEVENWPPKIGIDTQVTLSENIFYQSGDDLEDVGTETFTTNPDHDEEFFAGKLSSGLGSLLAFFTIGWAGSVAGVSPLVTSGGVGALAGGAGGFDDATNNGATLEEAYEAFYYNAGIGVSEALPITKALERINRATDGSVNKIVKAGVVGGLEELIQEVFQTAGGNLVASDLVGYDEDRGLFYDTGDAAKVGFTLGAAMNVLTAVLGQMVSGRRNRGSDQPDGPPPPPGGSGGIGPQPDADDLSIGYDPDGPAPPPPGPLDAGIDLDGSALPDSGLTEEDRASPLDNEDIVAGRTLIDEVLSGKPHEGLPPRPKPDDDGPAPPPPPAPLDAGIDPDSSEFTYHDYSPAEILQRHNLPAIGEAVDRVNADGTVDAGTIKSAGSVPDQSAFPGGMEWVTITWPDGRTTDVHFDDLEYEGAELRPHAAPVSETTPEAPAVVEVPEATISGAVDASSEVKTPPGPHLGAEIDTVAPEGAGTVAVEPLPDDQPSVFAPGANTKTRTLINLKDAEKALKKRYPGTEAETAADTTVLLDPDDIQTDAAAFQFKSGGDADGVTKTLTGTKTFEPTFAGVSIVWESKSGERFIVDGHQRLELAKRLKAEGQQPQIRAEVLREADGWTQKEARLRGTTKNLAEGGESTSALDIARVIRDGGADTVKQISSVVPPGRKAFKDGRELASLGDAAFGMVINGVVDAGHAAEVGRSIDGDAKQLAALGILAKNPPANQNQARLMVAQIRAAGFSEGVQTGLFGKESMAETLIVERTKILDSVTKHLKTMKNVFKTALSGEDILSDAGNVLDAEANQKGFTENETIAFTIEKLANRKGPVSDALNKAAADLKGGATVLTVRKQFLKTLAGDSGTNSQERRDKDAGNDSRLLETEGLAKSKPVAAATKAVDTVDGRKQGVIPGAEKISDRKIAERQMDKPLRGGAAAAEGLFDDDARNQIDIFDQPPPARKKASRPKNSVKTKTKFQKSIFDMIEAWEGRAEGEAIVDAANEAHAKRMDVDQLVGGDKFDLDRTLAEDGFGAISDDDYSGGSIPISDLKIPEGTQEGDALPVSAVQSWEEFEAGDAWPGEPSFSRTLPQEDFEIVLTQYDPNDLDDGIASLELKDRQATEDRVLKVEIEEQEVDSVEDALSHKNHHARAAAFRKVLDILDIEYEQAGTEGFGSEYVYVATKWNDEGTSQGRGLKIRFADHERQSGLHGEAHFNISDKGGYRLSFGALERILEVVPAAKNRLAPALPETKPPAMDKKKLDKTLRTLTRRLADLGLSDKVALRVVNAIRYRNDDGSYSDVNGQYLDRLITISMTSEDAAWTLNHEIVHALRDLGLIRPLDWRVLEKAALARPGLMRRVRALYAVDNLTEEQIVEEAVAEMFPEYVSKKKGFKGILRAAMERIRSFIRALSAAFTGTDYQVRADEIMRDIDSGRTGRGEAKAGTKNDREKASRQGNEKKPYEFKKESEERFLAAKDGAGLIETTREALVALWDGVVEGFTRHHKDLPVEVRFADLSQQLRAFEAAPEAAKQRILRHLNAITKEMSETDYDLFTRKVMLDDLQYEVGEEHDLPFGLKPEEVPEALEKVNKAIEMLPRRQEALETRKKLNGAVTNEMLEAGVVTAEQLKNPAYFRHMVLEHAIGQHGYKMNGNPQLKTPFQHERKGSKKDINANFLEAEFDWLMKAMIDIEKAKLIEWIKTSPLNIRADVILRAKERNDKAVKKLLEEELKSEAAFEKVKKDGSVVKKDGNVVMTGPLNEEWNDFKKRIAAGMAAVKKAVKDMEVPPEHQAAVESLLKDDLETATESPFALMSWLMDGKHPGQDGAAAVFKALAERQAFRKQVLGKNYADITKMDDLIKLNLAEPGSATWQPQDGNTLYTAQTLSENAKANFLKDVAADPNLTTEANREKLEKYMDEHLVVGGERFKLIVPEEVAATLDSLTDVEVRGALLFYTGKMMRGWKIMMLLFPTSAVKYMWYNLTGDTDALIAGAPGALKKVRAATREITNVMFHGDAPSDLYILAEKLGVLSGQTIQEIPDVSGLDEFKNLFKTKKSLAGKAVLGAGKAWEAIKRTNQWRENLLRFAAFMYYREGLLAGKSVQELGYGGAKRHIVDAITDLDKKAAYLARELLGDYGNLSTYGQFLRHHVIPFYSWMEVNIGRYNQLIRNASKAGRSTLVLQKFMQLAFLTLVIEIFNRVVMDDEEEAQTYDQRSRQHINLGSLFGDIITVPAPGAFRDVLSWGGGDALNKAFQEMADGKDVDVAKLTEDMAKAPVNKIISGIRPDVKLLMESLFGFTLFPNVFDPRANKDPWRNFAQMFRAGTAFDFVSGNPNRGFLSAGAKVFVNISSPGENAYHQTRADAIDWNNDRTETSGTALYPTNVRSSLVYNILKSLRYEDDSSRIYYSKKLQEKIDEDNKDQTTSYVSFEKVIFDAARHAHPLNRVPRRDRQKYIEGLTETQRHKLDVAERWYEGIFGGYLSKPLSITIDKDS